MNKQKNIQTVAPFLADDFVELDEPIFDNDEYLKLLTENEDKLGNFKKYLMCKLHDSWITEIKKESDKVELIINDISTFVFAASLIEKYNLQIDTDNLSFPLIVEFSGDIEIEYCKVEENGDLKKIEPVKLDDYLYEQITKLDSEKVEIVFHFWKSNIEENKDGERIIVIVSGKNLNVREEQSKVWNETFNNDFDKFYNHFKEQFEGNRYLGDHNECEELIKEIENNIIK